MFASRNYCIRCTLRPASDRGGGRIFITVPTKPKEERAIGWVRTRRLTGPLPFALRAKAKKNKKNALTLTAAGGDGDGEGGERFVVRGVRVLQAEIDDFPQVERQ